MNRPNEFGCEVITPDGRGQILAMHGRGVVVGLNHIEFGQQLSGLDRGNGGRHRFYQYAEVHIIKGSYCFNDRADDYNEQSYNDSTDNPI